MTARVALGARLVLRPRGEDLVRLLGDEPDAAIGADEDDAGSFALGEDALGVGAQGADADHAGLAVHVRDAVRDERRRLTAVREREATRHAVGVAADADERLAPALSLPAALASAAATRRGGPIDEGL